MLLTEYKETLEISYDVIDNIRCIIDNLCSFYFLTQVAIFAYSYATIKKKDTEISRYICYDVLNIFINKTFNDLYQGM